MMSYLQMNYRYLTWNQLRLQNLSEWPLCLPSFCFWNILIFKHSFSNISTEHLIFSIGNFLHCVWLALDYRIKNLVEIYIEHLDKRFYHVIFDSPNGSIVSKPLFDSNQSTSLSGLHNQAEQNKNFIFCFSAKSYWQ